MKRLGLAVSKVDWTTTFDFVVTKQAERVAGDREVERSEAEARLLDLEARFQDAGAGALEARYCKLPV